MARYRGTPTSYEFPADKAYRLRCRKVRYVRLYLLEILIWASGMPAWRHHLDQITCTELKTESLKPRYQLLPYESDSSVEVAPVGSVQRRSRFGHSGYYRRESPIFELHQNHQVYYTIAL